MCILTSAEIFLNDIIRTAAKAYAETDRSSHIVDVAVYLLGSMTNAANLGNAIDDNDGKGQFGFAYDDSKNCDAEMQLLSL